MLSIKTITFAWYFTDSMGNDVRDMVRGTFEQYLQNRDLRKTQERFAILDAIYSIEGHFTMEELQVLMNASNFHVSRATLYNTIDLLIDARLVVRHKFDNSSQYEKSFNTTTHFHRICTVCGTVTEVCDDELREMIERTHSRGFTIEHTSLYIYGMCAKCMAVRKRKEKKIKEQKK